MSDLSGLIKAIDKFIPADPMMSDYTQGISVGLAIATRCVEEFSQENDDSSQGLVKDLISRKDACEAVKNEMESWLEGDRCDYRNVVDAIMDLPSAEKAQLSEEDATKDATSDLISRKKALDVIKALQTYKLFEGDDMILVDKADVQTELMMLPSAQQEKEIPRRVIWSGWKGTRYTRYKCPNCNKPVKNDDVYCHRCGQKLMFPHISHTPCIEGQKQELIVRWDDEE